MVELPDWTGVKTVEMTQSCQIDTARMRTELEAAQFKAADTLKPVFVEPECIRVTVPPAVIAPERK